MIVIVNSELLIPEAMEQIGNMLWEIIVVNDLSPIRIYTEIFAIKFTLKNSL